MEQRRLEPLMIQTEILIIMVGHLERVRRLVLIHLRTYLLAAVVAAVLLVRQLLGAGGV